MSASQQARNRELCQRVARLEFEAERLRAENNELRWLICDAASWSETTDHYDGTRLLREKRDQWIREAENRQRGEAP